MISNQLWKLIVDYINDHFANANQQLIVHQISHQVIDRSQELFSYKLTDATRPNILVYLTRLLLSV